MHWRPNSLIFIFLARFAGAHRRRKIKIMLFGLLWEASKSVKNVKITSDAGGIGTENKNPCTFAPTANSTNSPIENHRSL